MLFEFAACAAKAALAACAAKAALVCLEVVSNGKLNVICLSVSDSCFYRRSIYQPPCAVKFDLFHPNYVEL